MSVPTTSRGYQVASSSNTWWAGALDENESQAELRHPKSAIVFDQMRRQDPQCVSVLRAVGLPIRRTTWRLDPNGARDEVVEHVAADLNLPIVGQDAAPKPLRTRDRFSWADHLRHALLMLPIGHSFFEQVYRPEGQVHRLRKLMWLPHRTISRIDVAGDGGLRFIQQTGGLGANSDPKIPVEHLVAYISEREGGNWLGQSLLRGAHTMWWLKNRALRTQAQTFERNGLGVPIYEGAEAPAGLKGKELEDWLEDDLQRGETLATSFRAGDAAGASHPHGAKLTLQGVTGTLPDVEKGIRYYDEQIARAVLAHFLNLGTETGSWALGSTFADFFVLSLQTVALQIADVTNQHVIEDLVDVNWGEDERAPLLVFDEIGSKSPATAEAIKLLLDSEAISPDDKLEEHLRVRFGLPASDPGSVRPLQRNTATPSAPPQEES